jgi:hypothetical protein
VKAHPTLHTSIEILSDVRQEQKQKFTHEFPIWVELASASARTTSPTRGTHNDPVPPWLVALF